MTDKKTDMATALRECDWININSTLNGQQIQPEWEAGGNGLIARRLRHLDEQCYQYVEELLTLGANPNALHKDKDSHPLHIIAEDGDFFWQLAFAQLLLGHGADPDALNESGRAPFYTAYDNYHFELSCLFLSRMKGNVDLFGDQGVSALYHACMHDQNAGFIKFLLAHGASHNFRERCNDTPLHEALKRRCYQNALVLLDAGADPSLCNDYDETCYDEINFVADKHDDPIVALRKEIVKCITQINQNNISYEQESIARRHAYNMAMDEDDDPKHESATASNGGMLADMEILQSNVSKYRSALVQQTAHHLNTPATNNDTSLFEEFSNTFQWAVKEHQALLKAAADWEFTASSTSDFKYDPQVGIDMNYAQQTPLQCLSNITQSFWDLSLAPTISSCAQMLQTFSDACPNNKRIGAISILMPELKYFASPKLEATAFESAFVHGPQSLQCHFGIDYLYGADELLNVSYLTRGCAELNGRDWKDESHQVEIIRAHTVGKWRLYMGLHLAFQELFASGLSKDLKIAEHGHILARSGGAREREYPSRVIFAW